MYSQSEFNGLCNLHNESREYVIISYTLYYKASSFKEVTDSSLKVLNTVWEWGDVDKENLPKIKDILKKKDGVSAYFMLRDLAQYDRDIFRLELLR